MSEPIRFYFDEHVSKAVAEGLRRRGVDVLRAQEAGRIAADDRDHLDLAVREERVIFTQDADFLRMHDSGLSHHGIVYAPQGTPIGRIVRGLMLIHDVLRREEMKDHVEFL